MGNRDGCFVMAVIDLIGTGILLPILLLVLNDNVVLEINIWLYFIIGPVLTVLVPLCFYLYGGTGLFNRACLPVSLVAVSER